MSAQRADVEIEVTEHEPTPDVHDGRPQRPEYRERGLDLMGQWLMED